MKQKLMILLTALCLLTTSASAQISNEQFGKLMKDYLASTAGQDELGKALQGIMQNQQKRAQEEQMKAAAAELENQFKNPVKVELASHTPVKGPAAAKVTIVEFSDFECPYCKRGKETIDQILKAYPNDVKVAFVNLPLPMHQNAKPAAVAALAAGKQGKFWEFHDAMFNNQRSLNEEFYIKTATELKLDLEKFKKDMASEDLAKAVEADAEKAQKLGIQGTPGFYVNGVAVKGAYPFDHFKTIIDRHLGKKM